MNSWKRALDSYFYPVDLREFADKDRFLGYFATLIEGDRVSTIEFENRFRRLAPKAIESYFEVIFWKLYSQRAIRQRSTSRIMEYVLNRKTDPQALHDMISDFAEEPCKKNLKDIRRLLGIKTDVLAVALTFPAFLDPDLYPMVDNNIARWVNANYAKHNKHGRAKLTPFALGYTSLRDNDFDNYLSWVCWCREMAQILSTKTESHWRPRDVEMAVFTAYRSRLCGQEFELEALKT